MKQVFIADYKVVDLMEITSLSYLKKNIVKIDLKNYIEYYLGS